MLRRKIAILTSAAVAISYLESPDAACGIGEFVIEYPGSLPVEDDICY